MLFKINTSNHHHLLRGVSYFTSKNIPTVTVGLALLIKPKEKVCIAKGLVLSKGYTDTVTDYDRYLFKKLTDRCYKSEFKQ